MRLGHFTERLGVREEENKRGTEWVIKPTSALSKCLTGPKTPASCPGAEEALQLACLDDPIFRAVSGLIPGALWRLTLHK